MDRHPHEPIIEPELPIVDCHHHLWLLSDAAIAAAEGRPTIFARQLVPLYRRQARYLVDEFVADATSGHNVRASVFVDAHAMYRRHGPEHLRSTGEIEFVAGVAAMADSGAFGDLALCAGIVGGVDLGLGAAVEEVLAEHVRAGGGRYRGVRSRIARDDDATIIGPGIGVCRLDDPAFREGFGRLAPFSLSFDAWLLEPQLPDLLDLARTCPDTQIIVNHAGAPIAVGRYQGLRAERFATWRDSMRSLATCPNVAVKIGGFGTLINALEQGDAPDRASSAGLAEAWRPYVETCIELFGAGRSMFESNFPVDSAAGSYALVWNAFKHLTAGCSAPEKADLYAGTAAKIYRLELDGISGKTAQSCRRPHGLE